MVKGERTGRQWRYEAVSEDLIYGSAVVELVYSKKSRYQTIEVLDSAAFGRVLILDGKTQSAEIDEFIYHEMFLCETIFHLSVLTEPDDIVRLSVRLFVLAGCLFDCSFWLAVCPIVRLLDIVWHRDGSYSSRVPESLGIVS